MTRSSFPSYIDQLLAELDQFEADYLALLAESEIVETNYPSYMIGWALRAWSSSSPDQEARRMSLLATLRNFKPRFLLLFPHPTPEIAERHDKAFDVLDRWLARPYDDHSVPGSIPQAEATIRRAINDLKVAKDLLAEEEFSHHLVVDTNVLLDDPNMARFTDVVGRRYLVHLLPVVLRELDDQKRAGRNADLRESAKRAGRRLKSLRDNGDLSAGARVAGDVWAKFDHLEPGADGLPSWLDLDVPDDRFIASTLLLISSHPSATTLVVTGDLNLQTKLAAVRLPYLDPET